MRRNVYSEAREFSEIENSACNATVSGCEPLYYLSHACMTHTGEYRGIAPTGKKITGPSVVIYRIVDGKVVERWSVVDMSDFYKQLGVVEYKGFPDEAT